MKIKYYDRTTEQTVELEINADCVAVVLPAQEDLPEIEVNVNTDAIMVDVGDEERVGFWQYSDIVADLD